MGLIYYRGYVMCNFGSKGSRTKVMGSNKLGVASSYCRRKNLVVTTRLKCMRNPSSCDCGCIRLSGSYQCRQQSCLQHMAVVLEYGSLEG